MHIPPTSTHPSNGAPHLLQRHLSLSLPSTTTIAPKPRPELKRRETLQQLEGIGASLQFGVATGRSGSLGDDIVVDEDAGEDADGGAVEGGERVGHDAVVGAGEG